MGAPRGSGRCGGDRRPRQVRRAGAIWEMQGPDVFPAPLRTQSPQPGEAKAPGGPEPSAWPRGLRTLSGSGSFVPPAGSARLAARWRGLGGPGQGEGSDRVASPAEKRRNRPGEDRSRPPARPRPSLPGRAGPTAPPAAGARPEPARTCGQLCAFGLLTDRIWRFCSLRGRLLRPRRFCLQGSLWGTPRADKKRSCLGSWRREPFRPSADCCLEPALPFSLRPLPAVKQGGAA